MRRLWVFFGIGSTACSHIVSSEPEVIYCKEIGHIGSPACRANYICADGVCEACSAIDACGDAVDNDCNGVVDDRCAHYNPGFAGQAGQAGAGLH